MGFSQRGCKESDTTQQLNPHGCLTMPCKHLLSGKENQLYVYMDLLFFWISFPFRLPKNIEESPLCYTVGSH